MVLLLVSAPRRADRQGRSVQIVNDPVTSARNAMNLWGFPHGGTTPVLGNPSLQQRPWSGEKVSCNMEGDDEFASDTLEYGINRQIGNNSDGNGWVVGAEETRTSESPGTSDGGGACDDVQATHEQGESSNEDTINMEEQTDDTSGGSVPDV
ncbi:hypothetical protein Dimus_015025, partial [Dionaea muscipula]